MLTCDDDFAEKAKGFIKKTVDDDKPFFVWVNFTHMHLYTHTKKESLGQAGRWQSPYHDTMIDHDKNVGSLLDYLDELGIADNTVRRLLDRQRPAPQLLARRRHDTVPQREEHELGRGVPHSAASCAIPGKIKAGSVSNEIVQHHDWLPTFLELAGNKTVVEDLKKGVKAIGRTYKNHIDGVSLLDYLTGKTDKSPRKMFVYISDDGDTLGLRYDNWKIVFMEQRCKGTMAVWGEPFTPLRVAKLFNLRTDPYEFADITSNCVLRVVHPARLHHLRSDRDHDEVQRDVRRLPEDPEAEYLHRRPGGRQDARHGLRQLRLTSKRSSLHSRARTSNPRVTSTAHAKQNLPRSLDLLWQNRMRAPRIALYTHLSAHPLELLRSLHHPAPRNMRIRITGTEQSRHSIQTPGMAQIHARRPHQPPSERNHPTIATRIARYELRRQASPLGKATDKDTFSCDARNERFFYNRAHLG